METDDTKNLLVETQELSHQVKVLNTKVDIGQAMIKRLRQIVAVCVVLLIGGFISSLFIYDLYGGVRASVTTSCENRNESAGASNLLWQYVFDVSEQNAKAKGKDNVDMIESMRDYTDELYAPRDCSKPGKKYPAPTPPPIS